MMVVIVNVMQRIQIMLRWSVVPSVAVALVLGALGMADAQTSSANKNSGRKPSSSQARSEEPQELSTKEILADSETTFPMDENLVLRGYSNRRWIAQPATVAHE